MSDDQACEYIGKLGDIYLEEWRQRSLEEKEKEKQGPKKGGRGKPLKIKEEKMAKQTSGRPDFPNTRKLKDINAKLQQLRETENKMKRAEAEEGSFWHKVEAADAWNKALGREQEKTAASKRTETEEGGKKEKKEKDNRWIRMAAAALRKGY